MGNSGEAAPRDVDDAAGFVASMQRLKERSGLTYRELEERAAQAGDVLARSTLADVLRRQTLPRPEVLAAFVRACGEGHQVGAWLKARERIAARTAVAPGTAPEREARPGFQDEGGAGVRPARTRRRTAALATALVVPLLAAGSWALLPERSGDPGAPAPSAAGSRAPVDGWVSIRPARTPTLCLTDGRDRRGAYASAVAVQLPCAQARVPRTYLEPLGERLYRIQWHHPQLGKGCLTVLATGPVTGMLEPRTNCAQGTMFRLDPAGTSPAAGFRLRPVGSDRCIGIAGGDTAVGAEAVQQRCTGGPEQRFLVRAD